jgi:hypothetical protein
MVSAALFIILSFFLTCMPATLFHCMRECRQLLCSSFA